jgi:hypothetical protein
MLSGVCVGPRWSKRVDRLAALRPPSGPAPAWQQGLPAQGRALQREAPALKPAGRPLTRDARSDNDFRGAAGAAGSLEQRVRCARAVHYSVL